MKLKSIPLAIILFVILFGGIALTTALNWWQTEGSKQPARFESGEAAGEFNPADIRGSYTFGDIERAFGVPSADLAAAFAIETEDPAAFAIKDLESIYAELAAAGTEIGTTSVRYFVALYTGLPYTLTGDVYLLRPAVEMLIARGGLTDEQTAYLLAHTVEVPAAVVEPIENVPTIEHVESAEDRTVKGKTTFAEVLDWGVPEETIVEIIGGPLPNPLVKVKDYCQEQGLPFETVKLALQAEIDKIVP
jgi:hypothetical protein